jgi:hypothetical protein
VPEGKNDKGEKNTMESAGKKKKKRKKRKQHKTQAPAVAKSTSRSQLL